MANPQVLQGSLNRVKASVVWATNPQLNITSSYLGRPGIRFAPEGESTAFLNTLTGAVTSPEPYQLFNMTVALVKPQALADLYKSQIETNALIGDGTVYPDVISPGLGVFNITNCAIETFREVSFAGDEPTLMVVIKGYWLINSNMFL